MRTDIPLQAFPAGLGQAPVPREIGRRRVLGQFLTPDPVADLMASLFRFDGREINLLDAGAGAGALSAALTRHFCRQRRRPKRISLTAFEIDGLLVPRLKMTIEQCGRECQEAGIQFSAALRNENFIETATSIVGQDLFAPRAIQFDAAIVNPPYRKIRADSLERRLLRQAGIEASNLYSGFVTLIARLLTDGGELVGITPRSFCNGPYFKPFRVEFLQTMAIQQLHIFESRTAAFKRDDVLQENVIFHAVKNAPKPDNVIISSSSGHPGGAVSKRNAKYASLVDPDDPEQFIHLTTDDSQACARAAISRLSVPLPELGLSVSTGRVVDFRVREFLRDHPEQETVPLVYPCHFNGGFVHWPKEESRKPNAILWNHKTRELLVPAGVYVLVKRFSPKEEPRRIVACIWDSGQFPAPFVGFENHLNYFHSNGRGMSMPLARGLAAFLNSSLVDSYFRQFNGHTQVNAADLRNFRYPAKAQLERIGRRACEIGFAQKNLDAAAEKELFNG